MAQRKRFAIWQVQFGSLLNSQCQDVHADQTSNHEPLKLKMMLSFILHLIYTDKFTHKKIFVSVPHQREIAHSIAGLEMTYLLIEVPFLFGIVIDF